jgi:hypothetical protein
MNRHLSMLMLVIGLAVWVSIMLAPWVIVGPWRLGRSMACRMGLHGRIIPQVNPANRNTEGQCVVCNRFLPITRIPLEWWIDRD